MKITLFGASGRTGRLVAARALQAGHTVRAAVRSPEAFTQALAHLAPGDLRDHVEVVRAEVTNHDEVSAAVQGAHAVVSVIGPTKSSPKGMMEEAARAIVAAMREHRVTRVIAMTGAGVRFPQDEPALLDRLIRFLLKTLQPHVLNDSIRYVDTLTREDLEWTVVRGPMLHDKDPVGEYRVGYVGKGPGPRASRGNVARFIVDELEARNYLNDAPMISD
ncbi:MAG: NAD(P)-dependent oxidoreductase [Spirochaetota bacterium]